MNTPSQSGLGSNANEEIFLTPPELEPHHQMQFSVVLKTPFFVGRGSCPLCRRYNQTKKNSNY